MGAMNCIRRLLIASAPSLSISGQVTSNMGETNGSRGNKDLPKFSSLVAKSSSNYLHTYIQELNNLIMSHKEPHELYFNMYSLRMYVSFCPVGVIYCQMSYILEMLSNTIALITGPALCDNDHAILTMIMYIQTIVIISESIGSEGTNIAISRFFVYVYKCRLLANRKLKVSSDEKWQNIYSLCNFWVEILAEKKSISDVICDIIAKEDNEVEILSAFNASYVGCHRA